MERLLRGINTHVGKVLDAHFESDGEVTQLSLRILGRKRHSLYVYDEATNRFNWFDRDEVISGMAGVIKFHPSKPKL